MSESLESPESSDLLSLDDVEVYVKEQIKISESKTPRIYKDFNLRDKKVVKEKLWADGDMVECDKCKRKFENKRSLSKHISHMHKKVASTAFLKSKKRKIDEVDT